MFLPSAMGVAVGSWSAGAYSRIGFLRSVEFLLIPFLLSFQQARFAVPCSGASSFSLLADRVTNDLRLPQSDLGSSCLCSSLSPPAHLVFLTQSGFAVMKLGWRWSFIELTIIALLAFVILIVFLPETMGDNILYRRAVRLRKLTGNGELRAACELGSKAEHTALQHLKTNLVHTLMILPEPIMAFVSIYLGLVYGVLYVVRLSSLLPVSTLRQLTNRPLLLLPFSTLFRPSRPSSFTTTSGSKPSRSRSTKYIT